MKFRTELQAIPAKNKINYNSKLLFLGSCFAENMGSFFKTYRFQTTLNPFGTLYSSTAISNAIAIALDDSFTIEDSLIHYNDLWTSFYVHSSLSKPEKDNFITVFNERSKLLKDSILGSDFIFITLGTAYVFEHIESEEIVSNCHKIPQKEFRKRLLTEEIIKNDLQRIIDQIKTLNPKAKIVFTLSPVRYLRDGFEENQLSKALLYLSIKKCISENPKAIYFPSYEYVLDDLRDYRFYKKDLVHPNDLALEYVWSKLITTYFDDKTQLTLKQVEKINKRLQHKFFRAESKDSIHFKQQTKQLIDNLVSQFPNIQF
jgi:hypothetical protein